MGLGTIGWGFSKTDGVPVGLVESQWGRLSMGMLQGVGCYSRVKVALSSTFEQISDSWSHIGLRDKTPKKEQHLMAISEAMEFNPDILSKSRPGTKLST